MMVYARGELEANRHTSLEKRRNNLYVWNIINIISRKIENGMRTNLKSQARHSWGHLGKYFSSAYALAKMLYVISETNSNRNHQFVPSTQCYNANSILYGIFFYQEVLRVVEETPRSRSSTSPRDSRRTRRSEASSYSREPSSSINKIHQKCLQITDR